MVDLSGLPQLLATEQWAAAERVLRRAAQNKAASAPIFYNLAKVLEMQGKDAQRETWLKRALARDPGHAKAWFELARLRQDAGDLADAEAGFAKAAALDSQDLEAWRMVARLRLRLGAWRGVQEAVMHLPADAETRVMAYRAACELGQDTTRLRAALLKDPDIRPEALKALTRVAKGAVPLRLPSLDDQEAV